MLTGTCVDDYALCVLCTSMLSSPKVYGSVRLQRRILRVSLGRQVHEPLRQLFRTWKSGSI